MIDYFSLNLLYMASILALTIAFLCVLTMPEDKGILTMASGLIIGIFLAFAGIIIEGYGG